MSHRELAAEHVLEDMILMGWQGSAGDYGTVRPVRACLLKLFAHDRAAFSGLKMTVAVVHWAAFPNDIGKTLSFLMVVAFIRPGTRSEVTCYMHILQSPQQSQLRFFGRYCSLLTGIDEVSVMCRISICQGGTRTQSTASTPHTVSPGPDLIHNNMLLLCSQKAKG